MQSENPITYFAETDSRNKRVRFGIKDEDRLRHVYSIGKTGMGKSTMLENMAIQDIQNGNGMAFLDPHGKTADLLLDYIPEHRMKDVIYFAPFDTDFPISFNVMEDVGADKRHLVISGLMSAFEKIWVDAWSARMAYILQNTLAALLEYPGATLLGVNRMYSDKAYRAKVVENITDPTIKAFWTEEYAKYTDKYTQEATPAIQNKIGQFASNPLVRNIIGQPISSFDIRKIMDEKKILIVNLSKGLMGEGNANLLGSMLVTKIYLAAMSRADADPVTLKKLPNFYLYVDEFQSFANKSFADILSEARKYKLSLNITHQYIEQMEEEVRSAVFGNVGTMISFRVGSFDAEILEKEFAPVFTMEDIVNLGFVQIYLKLMIDGVASKPFSATTLPPIPKPEVSFRDEVLETSRSTYAHRRAEVEQAIKDSYLSESAKSVVSGSAPSTPRPVSSPRPMEPAREPVKTEIKPQIPIEPRMEVKSEPKVEPKNILASAIKEAMKGKENPRPTESSGRAKVEIKTETKKEEVKVETKTETISLQQLTHGDKNKNKGPSLGNINALKEAIAKAKAESVKSQVSPKAGEVKPQEPKVESKKESDFAPNFAEATLGKKATSDKEVSRKKEVPEDVLRKVLKGE